MQLAQDLVRVNQPTFGNIRVRRLEGSVKGCAVRLAQPITGVESEQLHFGAFRQLGGLIDDQAPSVDTCGEGHNHEIITMPRAQQRVAMRIWPSHGASAVSEPMDRRLWNEGRSDGMMKAPN